MDLYAENILDHFKHPRGKAPIANPDVTHEEKNISCGDTVTVQLSLEGNRIAGIGWSGEGCAVSQAAMSMLAEELHGTTLSELAALSADDVRTLLGVPISVRRSKCALLALHALKNAQHKLRGKPEQSWHETIGA